MTHAQIIAELIDAIESALVETRGVVGLTREDQDRIISARDELIRARAAANFWLERQAK
jgi:hypothetical protein